MFLLLNKAVLVGLSLIVVGSTTVYGGIKVNEHRQVYSLINESRALSTSGKYQEAVVKLAETENKWTVQGTKKEIERLKEENKLLLQSSKDYELGKEIFDNKDYSEALEILKKVDSRDVSYPKAKSLIELAEEKINKSKGEVAGVKTERKKTAPATIEVSTPTIPATIPTATPIKTTQPTSYSYPSPQSQSSAPQSTYKQPTISDYAQNFVAVIYGFDLANQCYQQAISQITNGDRTGFNVTLDQCRSIVSPLQSIIHKNISPEVKRMEYNLGSAWGQYNYLFSQMGSLSVSVDHSNADPALDMFKADLKVQEQRYQKAVNLANEAMNEWQAISQ